MNVTYFVDGSICFHHCPTLQKLGAPQHSVVLYCMSALYITPQIHTVCLHSHVFITHFHLQLAQITLHSHLITIREILIQHICLKSKHILTMLLKSLEECFIMGQCMHLCLHESVLVNACAECMNAQVKMKRKTTHNGFHTLSAREGEERD